MEQGNTNNQREMEKNIDGYIAKLSELIFQTSENSKKHASYRALVRMNGAYEEENGEKKRQDKLVDKSKKMGFEYALGYDKKNPQKISFCQFVTEGYNLDDDKKDVEKLYINCDRDKISEIAKKLMKNAKKRDVKLSFKIAYEDGISDNYERSEKIVIYTENEGQKGSIVDILKNINKKHKSLFNDKKSIPFMPKLDDANFICTPGKQKAGQYTVYQGLGQYPKAVVNTWNQKMSEVLQESLVFGVKMASEGMYAPFDPHDSTTKEVEDCLQECVNTYYGMSEDKRAQVKSLMESTICELCEKNGIPLDRKLIQQKNTFEQSLRDNVQNPGYQGTANRTQPRTIKREDLSI